MPRKTKEQIAIENDENIDNITTVESTKKRTSKSKATNNTEPLKTKKSTTSKTKPKETKKETTAKKVTSKTEPKKTKKEATAKKATSKTEPKKTKKETTAKKATSKTEPKKTKKEATTKKVTKSRVQTKTVSDKKTATTRKSKKKIEVVEYYDLPYRYNQTVVKVLAQTPNNLFIYWDISDVDRQNFEKHYGENFFENTRPVLVVHNNTLGYSFEVEINDFANSWYLHVADSKCDYKIELGRRPILKTEKMNEDYIYVAISNEIESPNDRILFDKNQKMVYFRNVKNGKLTGKSINSISFIRNMGKIYNIYDLYKAIYQNENVEEYFDLRNPSSGNPSSHSLSSRFK